MIKQFYYDNSIRRVLGLILFLPISVLCQSENEFSMSGKTKNISDGTQLLLQNPLTEQFIDSARVINNSFYFETRINEFPLKTFLWKDGSTARMIWLENNKMTFDATVNEFTNARVTGSKTDSLVTALRNKYRSLNSYEEIVKAEMDFIKNNPDHILSVHNLSIMASVFGKEKSLELYNNLSKENKMTEYGLIVLKFLKSSTMNVKIGDKYIDFSMYNQDNILTKLSQFEGNIILLEFWASWCIPCREQNPKLNKTYEKYKNKGFEIVGVSLDFKKQNWLKAIKQDKLEWIHLSELNGHDNLASLIYEINEIPNNILIDKSGFIIGKNLKPSRLNEVLSDMLLN